MLTIRIVKAKPWPRTFVGDKWGDWDLSLRFPVRIHFRLSHWSVHMIWNGIQFADGVSIPEIVSFQDEGPWLHRIVPDVVAAPDVIHAVPTLPAGKAAIREETASGLKIRCDKQGGILEIVDPRMFRPASETFCRGLSATAISLGGASGVDLDLPPARADSISSRTGSMRPSSLVVSRWPSRRLRWPCNWKPRASSMGGSTVLYRSLRSPAGDQKSCRSRPVRIAAAAWLWVAAR